MAVETTPVNNDETTKIIEEVRVAVQKARDEDAKRGARNKDDQKKLANKYLKEMKDTLDKARRYARSTDKKSEEKNGKEAKKVLLQAAIAARENLEVIPNKPKTQKILAELGSRDMTAETASAIQDRLGDYLLGEKEIVFSSGDQKTGFEKAFIELKNADEAAAVRFSEAVEKNASDYGLTSDQVKEKFIEAVPLEQRALEERARKFQENALAAEEKKAEMAKEYSELGSWARDEQLYVGRFNEEQMRFLKRLYSPDQLAKYIHDKLEGSEANLHIDENIRRIKEDYAKRNVSLPVDIRAEARAIWHQDVSNAVAGELFDVLDSLYIQFQKERAERTFEEVTQDDFMQGIKTTSLAIVRAMDSTAALIAEREARGDRTFANLKLYRETEEKYTTIDKEIEEKDENGKTKIIKKAVSRLVPLPVPQEINFSNYVNYLRSNFVHGQHRLEYLHNAKYIFNHPPGEHGFYGQLAGYAEKLSGTDIDEIMLLPDAPLVLEAFSLYDKMLDEQFAVQDWKHRPNQFSNKLEYVNTQLEEEMVERMKMFYGGTIAETKLRNVVNIAVGMARGIFLTEPEKSASADAVSPEGGGMYASYGTNDAGALTVFNPLHVMMRWQGEHMLPAYYFMTLEDGSQKMKWSHHDMWKNMETYKNSYIKGSKDLTGKKLFVDELVNITQVGGPAQRRSWRMEYALRDYFEYDNTENGKLGKQNVLKSFKSIENIGYEAMSWYLVKSKSLDGFKAVSFEASKDKQEFFKYLYKNYILDDPKDFSDLKFNGYVRGLRSEQENKVISGMKGIEAKGGSISEMIEGAVVDAFVQRTLAHEIAQRFPTKFLRMDRDRINAEGVSRWNKIYNKMLADGKVSSREQFDESMKDLVFAETLLRREISKEMRSRLQLQKKAKLWEIGEIEDTRLSAAKIRKLLSGINENGGLSTDENGRQRIERAIEVYKTIKATYLKPEFLNSIYAKEIDKFKFTFGIEDTDFSFIAFRGMGPRVIPRAIGDIGGMEKNIIGGIIDMPKMLNGIATSGKKDFSPVIEYMQKAKNQFLMVHGVGAAAEFNYKMAASVIAYFKKDTMAKQLFGIFGIGKRNSIAAEVAGRSSAVWEWDSRDIDRFCVALESLDLLKKNPYDLSIAPTKILWENYWIKIPFLNIPIKTPFKKRHADYEFNTRLLRKEFGGRVWDMSLDFAGQFLPLALTFLLWKFFQDALGEAEGKKK